MREAQLLQQASCPWKKTLSAQRSRFVLAQRTVCGFVCAHARCLRLASGSGLCKARRHIHRDNELCAELLATHARQRASATGHIHSALRSEYINALTKKANYLRV